MCTETTEGRKLVEEISRGIIDQVAPEESDIFDDRVLEFFQNPAPPDKSFK